MYTRSCNTEDFPAVFQLINAACAADHTRRVLESAFRQDYFSGPDGAPTERGIVALARDATITGFIWWEDRFDTEGDETLYGMAVQGWVAPEWRGQGVGSALLKAAERFAERSGKNTVRMSLRTYADIDGASALFEHFGYKTVRSFYKMTIELAGKQFVASAPYGVMLRSFRPTDLPALTQADNLFFADHWGSHAVSVEEWQHRMINMRPHDPHLWVIAWADEAIIGECLCHASLQDGPRDGWVAVVGVSKEWRGRGLGKLVLATGLRLLQTAGFETASLHVDGDNDSAVKLYRSLGMDVARTNLVYRKTLNLR